VQTLEATTLTSEQQRDLTYRMAVYSAMIEHVDTQLGRIVEHLKASGDFDDTLIVVASDNGASGLSSEMYARAPGARQWLTEHYPLIGDIDAYGKAGSFPVPSLSNAQVSSGPYFHTKNTLYEGGIRVPLIVKTPNASNDQDSPRIVDTFAHISDLYPTFADYAGASLHEPNELSGNSAKPLLDGTTNTIGDDQFGWELFGERAFRDGDLKLVFATPGNSGTGQYALYDLSKDPGETTDLASEQPDQVRRLSDLWDQYAADNNVIPVEFAAVNAASEALAPVIYAMDWAE
jgi:arylsulfatase A-like enzyme